MIKVADQEAIQISKMIEWASSNKKMVKFSIYCNNDTMFIASIDSNGKGDARTIMGMGKNLTEAMTQYSSERVKHENFLNN